MEHPLISVVTVVFNAVTTLENTILSVVNQTYPNIEYIIIDGGSTDGTVDIIKKYADRISYWVSEPDKGIYDAMNKALKVANGDFLIFLGADDMLFSSISIEAVVKEMKNMEYVYYGNVLLKEINKVYWRRFNKWKWGAGNICHQALFYPKTIYKSHEYNLEYKVYADYVYNLLLLIEGKVFCYVPIIVSLYRMDGYSSKTIDETFNIHKRALMKRAIGTFPYYYGRIYNWMLKRKQCIKCFWTTKEM